MYCNLSGNVCQNPVSTPQGYIFEKTLIEKHLSNNQKCPITQADLSVSDLISLQQNKGPLRPRPSSATSLSSLLHLFQNEWDSIMLETFNLKKRFEEVKQELSNSLYQYDAACRVIARLIKERDDARSELANTRKNMDAVIKETSGGDKAAKPEKMVDEGGDTFDEELPKISELAKSLSSERRRLRKAKLGRVLSAEKISKLALERSVKMETGEGAAIRSMELVTLEETLFLTGHKGGKVSVSSLEKPSRWSEKAHDGEVTHICATKNFGGQHTNAAFISSSTDGTTAIWSPSDAKSSEAISFDFSPSSVVRHHTAAITGLSLQPLEKHFATCSIDKTWVIFDIKKGAALRQSGFLPQQQTALKFHPDGLIFGVGGADGVLRVWDLSSQKEVASLEGHSSAVGAIAFSENGYYLATGDESGETRLWDLRKSGNLATLPAAKESPSAVRDLCFDEFGGHLAISGDFGLELYASKTWKKAKSLSQGTAVSSARFGPDGSFLAASLFSDAQVAIFGFAEK